MTLATTKAAESPNVLRGPLVIESDSVHLDASGHVTRSWFVRLPASAIADDLKQPDIWRRIQSSPMKSFRKFDRVTAVAFDQSWLADAVVGAADANSVVLAGLKIVQLPERTKPLPSDDKFRVVWSGGGYFVERRSDGQKVTATVTTEQMAERDMRFQYPSVQGR